MGQLFYKSLDKSRVAGSISRSYLRDLFVANKTLKPSGTMSDIAIYSVKDKTIGPMTVTNSNYFPKHRTHLCPVNRLYSSLYRKVSFQTKRCLFFRDIFVFNPYVVYSPFFHLAGWNNL